MAGAGWGQLAEMDGEPVSYDRSVNGASATGFPKSIDVLFLIDNASRKHYEDGRGDLSVGMVHVQVSDLGSNPAIATDTVTRADGTIWTVEEVKEIVGGVALVEVTRYAMISHGGRRARVER